MKIGGHLCLILCACVFIHVPCDGNQEQEHLKGLLGGLLRKLVSRFRRDGRTTWTTRAPGTWIPLTGTPYKNLTEVEIASKDKTNMTDLDSNGFPKPALGTKRPITGTRSAHDIGGHTASQTGGMLGSLVDRASENATEVHAVLTSQTSTIRPSTRRNKDGKGEVKNGLGRGQMYITLTAVLAASLCVCLVTITTYLIKRRRQRKVVVTNA